MAERTYRDVIHASWRNESLFTVLFELTYACNLDCYFCYNDLSLKGEPLSRDRYFEIFEELRELGALNVVLSGGEPLAHPNFYELGARLRELGFVVRIKSNGHSLDRRVARRIRDEIDPILVEVSLHGGSAATHDRQTRVAGSFERLVSNVAAMTSAGLRVRINSTLTRWNEAEIRTMFRLADELGVPLQFDPEVTARDDGDREPLQIGASRAGVRALLDELARRATELAPAAATPAAPSPPSDRHCGAGSSGVAIDPFGNVYPCVQWRRPIGSLRESSLSELWHRSAGLAEVRRITQALPERLRQLERPLPSFCPGVAEAETGSAFGLYDAASQRSKLAGERRSLTVLS